MYTEKVTLRLTKDDKEKLQIEADDKKLPLTTLIRNKVSGNESKEFEPQLISTQYETFRNDVRLTNLKINSLDGVLHETKKFIEIPDKTTNDFKELLVNPIEYVTNKLYAVHSKDISFKISKHKLLELMEIDLTSLETAVAVYKKNSGHLIVDENGNVKSGVHIENYQIFTKNEAENERLALANDIISSYLRAKTFNRSITIGRVRDVFNPIVLIGDFNGVESQLSPCVAWVQGKR